MSIRIALWIAVTGIGLLMAAAPVRAQERITAAWPDGSPLFGAPQPSFDEPFQQAPGDRPLGRTEEGQSQSDDGEEAPIETDRDSFTPATTTVSPGRFILESAYTFIDNRRVYDTHSFPEIVLRYGLNEWIEVRFQWNFEVGGAGNNVSTDAGEDEFFGGGIERESQIGYGFKLKVTEQREWIPESALMAVGFTPIGGPDQNMSFVGTYVWGWTLPRRAKLDASLRYAADTAVQDGLNQWGPSVVLKIPLAERVNVHAEYFGIFTTEKQINTNAQYFSPGLHYLLTQDFEMGFRLGWGLNDGAARFFVNVGLGARF